MSEESKPSPLLGFTENFLLSDTVAVTSKTASAPIERVKLLVQNQGEMLKAGRLDRPYNYGVIDCTVRTFKSEGTYIDNIHGGLLHVCFLDEAFDRKVLIHF